MSGCGVCGSSQTESLGPSGSVPVQCTALYPDQSSARQAPFGSIQLALCSRCTAVTNSAFDASLVTYDSDYENSQLFSDRFRSFAQDLATQLVTDHDLVGGHVVEIGCGKGEFLSILVDAGVARATGYDPTYDPDVSDLGQRENVRIMRTVFDETSVGDRPDLVCLRHVLEHLENPVKALQSVRRATPADPPSVLYVEVPNAGFTFTPSGLWDIIYQHCTYFGATALQATLHASGFEPRTVRPTFGGQFLAAEALPAASQTPRPWPDSAATEVALDSLQAFGSLHRRIVDGWRDRLNTWAAEGQHIALWGAGAKGVTFLNLVGPNEIATVIDVNPRKQGRFLPGTGHRVNAPEELRSGPPDTVVVMNELYAQEIRQSLNEIGLAPKLVSV